MTFLQIKLLGVLFLLTFQTPIFGQDYIIFSIAQDLPMGYENEILKKNFYVNVGTKQGIRKGTALDVMRVITEVNPFESNKSYRYKVKVGELEVIYSDENSAIAISRKFYNGPDDLLLETDSFMIGDQVAIHIK